MTLRQGVPGVASRLRGVARAQNAQNGAVEHEEAHAEARRHARARELAEPGPLAGATAGRCPWLRVRLLRALRRTCHGFEVRTSWRASMRSGGTGVQEQRALAAGVARDHQAHARCNYARLQQRFDPEEGAPCSRRRTLSAPRPILSRLHKPSFSSLPRCPSRRGPCAPSRAS